MGGVILKSLFRIRKYRVGLSLILADYLELEDGCKIGHFNIIIVRKLRMSKGASIGHLNFIKGGFDLIMDERADIHLQNKISSKMHSGLRRRDSELRMRYHAKIGVGHLLDLTDSVTMDENAMLAGAGSQVWTHGFYFSKQGEGVARIDGPVHIGRNCYIGARCVICAGVEIGDAISVGACSCVSKSLTRQGLYVSQPLRYIAFDPDKRMAEMTLPYETMDGGTRVFRKETI